MDGMLGLDVPDSEWVRWKHRKLIQRDLCGPKEPENPLVRLMAEAQGVTEAETERPSDPDTARQAIRNTRARFLRQAAALMRLVKRDAEACEFEAVASRFTRSLVKRPRARLQTVSAHWPSESTAPPEAA